MHNNLQLPRALSRDGSRSSATGHCEGRNRGVNPVIGAIAQIKISSAAGLALVVGLFQQPCLQEPMRALDRDVRLTGWALVSIKMASYSGNLYLPSSWCTICH
ncbi:MAG: hypothetical protein IPF68_16780 [Bacteroidales bacterium]|nr:hypothetical protein [Bacteroidales bacterium]